MTKAEISIDRQTFFGFQFVRPHGQATRGVTSPCLKRNRDGSNGCSLEVNAGRPIAGKAIRCGAEA